METPVVGPGLFAAAGYFEDELEDFFADLLDGGVAGGDAASVDVDEVFPALGEGGARGYLDDWDHREAVGCAAAGGEDVHVHGGG